MIYIAIPHDRPPYLVDSEDCPPDEDAGDICFENDHRLHSYIELYQAPEYRGYQKEKVYSLFRRFINDGGGGDLVLV